MPRKMTEYRSKRLEKRRNTTHEIYSVGDEVLIFCPSYKRVQDKGTIESVVPHDNGASPPSYFVIVNGVKQKVNQVWIV